MPLYWFENYLTDRKQTVQFKTEHSEERAVKMWHAARKYPGTATVYSLC